MSDSMTLGDLQEMFGEFVESRGWRDPDSAKPQSARNLAASISIEAAEVLEHFQWNEDADPAEVAAELADVLVYTADLANVLGIDLEEAVREKMALNEQRFPVKD